MEGAYRRGGGGKVSRAFGHFWSAVTSRSGLWFYHPRHYRFWSSPKAPDVLPKSARALCWTVCPRQANGVRARLNAGLIGEDEGQKRVREVLGSRLRLDGRGEINLYAATPSPVFSSWSLTWSAGLWSAYCSGMSMGGAASYTLLTIGDGTVAQTSRRWLSLHGGGRRGDPRQYRSGCRRADGWPTVQ